MFIHFTTQHGSNVSYNADKIRRILQRNNRIHIYSKEEVYYDFKDEKTAQEVYDFILAQLKEA